jgi:hypothetical protein
MVRHLTFNHQGRLLRIESQRKYARKQGNSRAWPGMNKIAGEMTRRRVNFDILSNSGIDAVCHGAVRDLVRSAGSAR